jgi:outer membrane protein OmpA-like peptidoglycan-associated protein
MRNRTVKLIALTACLALFAAGLSTGCTRDPYTGERQVSKTAIGAGVGAAAGAATGVAVGYITGKKKSKQLRKRALIGAGIGAVAGGGVGAYMDYQEAKLRKKLQGTGVSVTREGDNIVLNMPGNITFDSGSAQIKPNFHEVLNSVSLVLQEYKKTYVDVAGHTDSTGSADFNQKLSEQRAMAVANYLAARKVHPDRFSVIGYGESQPIASNATASGREQNRRVEIELAPITQ